MPIQLAIEQDQRVRPAETVFFGNIFNAAVSTTNASPYVFHHLNTDILGKHPSGLHPHKVIEIGGRKKWQRQCGTPDALLYRLVAFAKEIAVQCSIQQGEALAVGIGAHDELAFIETEAIVEQHFYSGSYEAQAVAVDVVLEFGMDMPDAILHNALLLQRQMQGFIIPISEEGIIGLLEHKTFLAEQSGVEQQA